MKFPYGMTDFGEIVTNGYFYCDRTDRISLLEQAKSQLFIRPRRFGKSLLLSMLEHYYDVGRKDDFERIFGDLKVGKNPTPLRNSFFVLRWDFSCVDAGGSAEDIRRALFNHINVSIDGFMRRYRQEGYEIPQIFIDPDDAITSLGNLINGMVSLPCPIYLLIDEYDNFANTIMMLGGNSRERYEELVQDQGILKTVFKTVKSFTSSTGFDRVFITGVSPVVLSDITSGYNIAENIYAHPEFNDLCGFRKPEVARALSDIAAACGFEEVLCDDAMKLVEIYYDGYRFCREASESIYNPTLCLYFFKYIAQRCTFPRKMLDANLAVDQSKLRYVASIPKGRDILTSLMQRDRALPVSDIVDRFGLEDMLDQAVHDQDFLLSFLYYFGVLTIAGEDELGRVLLRVPNLVMQSLYVERVQRMLLPDPEVRDQGIRVAEQVYQKGDIGPLCSFVEETFFQALGNRDYRWANELTLKTAFMTLLYNDTLFLMDSEPEVGRRYADLVMIIRPDMRRYRILDVLIEFKFVPLGKTGLQGERVEMMTDDEVRELSEMKRVVDEGRQQVRQYGAILEKKHDNLRLQKFVVAALGFERVVWEKIA
ncbi:MAG TPA: AAA family ATPase [Desulfomicrobiaceae bacterium]|nr:AAA family ATPase [Desulfomicrobiaceae bacterium]